MPIYQYHCPICNREWEELQRLKNRNHPMCCGVTANRPPQVPEARIFKERHFQNMCQDPKEAPHISSWGQLSEECKKRGLVSDELPL